MKVVSITMVKNESDIIESFVRYYLNVVDEMIILDNGSTDETLKILNKLKDEKASIDKVHSLKTKLESLKAEMEKAERDYDLNKAAELKYSKIPALEKELASIEKSTKTNVENLVKDIKNLVTVVFEE